MKNHTIIIASCLAVSLAFRFAGELSKDERKFAINYLQETQTELTSIVKGLSEKQLNFKPTPDSWSVAQCIEHIALSEEFIFGLSQKALSTDAEAKELAFDAEMLIQVITDRSQKAKTFDALQPEDTFGGPMKALEAFRQSRAEHIAYLRKTDDPLHAHYHEFPFGTSDAYQVLLFMAAHSERHTLQIKEIMEHPDFPE